MVNYRYPGTREKKLGRYGGEVNYLHYLSRDNVPTTLMLSQHLSESYHVPSVIHGLFLQSKIITVIIERSHVTLSDYDVKTGVGSSIVGFRELPLYNV